MHNNNEYIGNIIIIVTLQVHQLGVCAVCRERMSCRGWSSVRLFCEHVVRLAAYVRARLQTFNTTCRVLIWDDMLRAADYINQVAPSGLLDAVEPVVWYYAPDAVPGWSCCCCWCYVQMIIIIT